MPQSLPAAPPLRRQCARQEGARTPSKNRCMRARSSLVLAALGATVVAIAPAGGAVSNPVAAGLLHATDYRLPNGWHLHPAGREVQTQRGPTGLTLTPDRKHVLVTTSGLFDEGVDVVNSTSLRMVPTQGTEFFRNPAVSP